MRPCAFIFFFYANLLRCRVVSFRGQKVRKDGGHQGKKKTHSGGQSEAKLQFCGSYLAVEEL